MYHTLILTTLFVTASPPALLENKPQEATEDYSQLCWGPCQLTSTSQPPQGKAARREPTMSNTVCKQGKVLPIIKMCYFTVSLCPQFTP